MNSSSYSSTWKSALDEDEARDESASSFDKYSAPVGGGSRPSSLQQHVAVGWKHQREQQQQQQQQAQALAPDRWGTAGVAVVTTTSPMPNANEWNDQRDSSQHSRSIWTDDNHSRRSDASTGTYSSQQRGGGVGSGMNHSSANNHNQEGSLFPTTATASDPLLGTMSRLSLGGGGGARGMANAPPQDSQSYYNNMRQQQHSANQNQNQYASDNLSVASSVPGLMGAGSGSTGGTGSQYSGWNPQQQQQQKQHARKPQAQVQVQVGMSSLAAAATMGRPSIQTVMPPPGFRATQSAGATGDSRSFSGSHHTSVNNDNDSYSLASNTNSERSRNTRGSRNARGERRPRHREKQQQQQRGPQHQHQQQGRGNNNDRNKSTGSASGRGGNFNRNSNPSMPPPPLRELHSLASNSTAAKDNDSMTQASSEHSFVSSLNRAAGPWIGAAMAADAESVVSSEAILQLLKPGSVASASYTNMGRGGGGGGSNRSILNPSTLEMDGSSLRSGGTITSRPADSHPILPQPLQMNDDSYASDDDDSFRLEEDDDIEDDDEYWEAAGRNPYSQDLTGSPKSKKKEWLLRMNRKLAEIPVGELDPAAVPLSAVMNAWAKTKSSQGASMVEMWLKRAQQEYDVGNRRVVPTTKMYTMAGKLW
jgi:hypothetical protein